MILKYWIFVLFRGTLNYDKVFLGQGSGKKFINLLSFRIKYIWLIFLVIVSTSLSQHKKTKQYHFQILGISKQFPFLQDDSKVEEKKQTEEVKTIFFYIER